MKRSSNLLLCEKSRKNLDAPGCQESFLRAVLCACSSSSFWIPFHFPRSFAPAVGRSPEFCLSMYCSGKMASQDENESAEEGYVKVPGQVRDILLKHIIRDQSDLLCIVFSPSVQR